MSYLNYYDDRPYDDENGVSDGLDDISLSGRINALDLGGGLGGYGTPGPGLGGFDSGIGLGSRLCV